MEGISKLQQLEVTFKDDNIKLREVLEFVHKASTISVPDITAILEV